MEVIFQVYFSNSFYVLISWAQPVKLVFGECHPIDDMSTSVEVMVWCHQATSHYLNQSWPTLVLPYGITRPQWVTSVSAARKRLKTNSLTHLVARSDSLTNSLSHDGKYSAFYFPPVTTLCCISILVNDMHKFISWKKVSFVAHQYQRLMLTT